MPEAAKLCTQMAIVHKGRLQASGTPGELLPRHTGNVLWTGSCGIPPFRKVRGKDRGTGPALSVAERALRHPKSFESE